MVITMGKQTDTIFLEIKNGTSSEDTVPFIEDSQIRRELREDIDKKYTSRNRLASDCAISPSHLSEFLKGKKELHRDKLLAIFICLGYGIDKAQTLLHRFNAPGLYVRKRRDYHITVGMKAGKSLQEIDELLIAHHLEPLGQYHSDKGVGAI